MSGTGPEQSVLKISLAMTVLVAAIGLTGGMLAHSPAILFDGIYCLVDVALTLAALLYIIIATGMGLLISTFMKSQIAAIFGTAIITLIPATQFSGMIDPVASLEGPGRWIGEVYPTSHFLTIARGTFSKALDLTDLWQLFIPLLIAIPLVMGLSILLLKKQEG